MTGPLWLQLQCSCDIWHLPHETRTCRKLYIMNKVLACFLQCATKVFCYLSLFNIIYFIFYNYKRSVACAARRKYVTSQCYCLYSHLGPKDAYSMFVVKLHLFKFKCSALCTLTFSQEIIALPAARCIAISTAFKAIFICHRLLTCTHKKKHKSMINVMRSSFDGLL